MSNAIDRKVVEMQFDNANFERNVKTSMSTLDKLKASLNFSGWGKSFDDLEKKAGKVDFSPMGSALQTVSVKFSAFEAIALGALERIGQKAIDTGIDLVKSMSIDQIATGWQKYSEKTISVGTLIAQGYDMETVEEQLGRLASYTDETSYEFNEMVTNIAKFTAAGQKLPQAVDALMGIANWAALSGQNAQTASRAMYQLSQAMGAGVMRKEDYKSIQNVSMDTIEFREQALAAGVAMGTLKKNADGTYTSIVKGAKKSTFSIAQFAENLTQEAWLTSDVMMSVYKKYSSAVDAVLTYAEEKDITASDAMKQMVNDTEWLSANNVTLDEFAMKAFKAAQEARTWEDAVVSAKEAVSHQWSDIYEVIFGNYEEATQLFTDLANKFYYAFVPPLSDFHDLLSDGLKGVDSFAGAFLETNFGIPGDALDSWRALEENETTTVEKIYDFIKANGELDESTTNIVSHWLQMHSEAAEASTENLAMSKDAFAQHAASILGITAEQSAALQKASSEFGTSSYQFRKEVENIYGKGKFGMQELAAGLFSVGDGIDSITGKDLDSYLTKTLKLTDDQVKTVRDLADQYGGTSKEVDTYLRSLRNIEGFGLANRGWTIQAIEGLLGMSDAFGDLSASQKAYKKDDVVSYIQSITGATKDQVEELWNLVNAETTSAEEAQKNQERIDEWVKAISGGDEELGKLILGIMDTEKSVKQLTGRTNLIEAFNNAWEGLGKILETVKKAFDEVFGTLDGGDIYNFTAKLKDLSEKLKLSDESLEKVKKTFEGFFSIFKIIGQALKPVLIPFKTLFGLISGGKKGILDFTSTWGDSIKKIADSGVVGEKATEFFTSISKAIERIYPYLKDLVSKFLDFNEIVKVFKDNGGGLSGVFSVISEKAKQVLDAVIDIIAEFTGWDVTEVKNNIDSFFSGMSEWLKNILPDHEKLVGLFGKLKEIGAKVLKVLGFGIGTEEGTKNTEKFGKAVESVKDTVETLGKKAESAKEGVGNLFKKLEPYKELNFKKGFGEGFTNFLNSLKGFFSDVTFADVELLATIAGICLAFYLAPSSPFDALYEFGKGLRYFGAGFEAFGEATKILTFGIVIAILVSSIKKLEEVDMGKAGDGLFALSILLGEMVGIIEILEHTTKGDGAKSVGSFLKIAISILLLGNTVKKIADIPESDLTKATIVISVLASVIAGCTFIMSQGKSGSQLGGAVASLLLVAGVIALAKTVVQLANAAKTSDVSGATLLIEELMVTLGGIVALFGVVGKSASNSGAMLAGAAAVMIIVIAISKLALTVALLANTTDPEKLNAAADVMIKIAAVVAVIGLVVAIIAKYTTNGAKNFQTFSGNVGNIGKVVNKIKLGFEGKLLAIAIAFIAVAGAVWIIADALIRISEAAESGDIWAASAIVIAFMAVLTGIVLEFSKAKIDPGPVLAGAGAMAIIAVALGIIAATIALLSPIAAQDMGAMFAASSVLLAFAVVIGIIVGILGDCVNSVGQVIAGAAAFAIIAASLSLITQAISVLAIIGHYDIGALIAAGAVMAVLTGVVGGLVLGFGAMGSASGMEAGAKAFLFIALAMDAMAASLIILGIGINVLGNAFEKSGAKIISGIGQMIDGFLMLSTKVALLIVVFTVEITNALAQAIPLITDSLSKIIESLINAAIMALSGSIPNLVTAALNMLDTVLAQLNQHLPNIINSLLELLVKVLTGLAAHTQEFVEILMDMLIGIIKGIAAKIPDLMGAIGEVLNAVVLGVVELIKSLDLGSIENAVLAIGQISLILIELGVIGLLVGPAILGAIGLLSLAAILIAGMALLGTILNIPGVQDFVSNGLAFATQLTGVINGFLMAMTALSIMALEAPLALIGIAAMTTVMAALEVVFLSIGGLLAIPGVQDFVTNGMTFAVALGDTITKFYDAMMALAMMGAVAALALVGVVAMSSVVIALQDVLLVVGMLASIPGVQSFVDTGAEMMAKIGGAIGDFVGAFIGGAIAGVAATLPVLGQNLSDFMKKAEGFISGAGNIDDKVVSGIGNLVAAIALIAVGEFLSSVTSFLGMGDIWVTFTGHLLVLGAGLASYGAIVAGLNFDAINQSISAIESVITISERLQSGKSFLDYITGQDSLTEFGVHLAAFAAGLLAFGSAALMVAPFTPAMMLVAMAINPTVDIAMRLQESKTFLDYITGQNALGDFGANLAVFAAGLVAFGTAALMVAPFTPAMMLVAMAISPTVSIAQELQESKTFLDYITGQNALGEFGANLAVFATGLVAFGTAALMVAPFTPAMMLVAMAIRPTVDIAQELQESKTFLDYITGQTALGEFGVNLGTFAAGLVAFGMASLLVAPYTDSMEKVIDGVEPAVKLSRRLQEEQTFLEFIFGQNALGDFGANLAGLAYGLVAFGAASNLVSGYTESMKAVLDAVEPAIGMSAKLKEQEDILTFIFGQTSLEKFGQNLAGLGIGLKEFAVSLEGLNLSDISSAVKAITDISNVEISSADGSNVRSLADNFKEASKSIKTAVENLKNVKGIDNAVANVQKLINVENSISTTSVSLINALAEALKSLATTGVTDFVNEFKNGYTDVVSATSGLIDAAIQGINDKSGDLESTLSEAIESAIKNADTSKANEFKSLGNKLMNKFISGLTEFGSGIEAKFSGYLSSTIKIIDGYYEKFRNSGSYLAQGFINGIESKKSAVGKAARGLGDAASGALSFSLDEHSPSKVAMKIGSYFGEGFILGIDEFVNAAGETASQVGDNAVKGLKESIDSASNMAIDFDNEFTIRPVLDLTEIQNGADRIHGMMDGFNGYSISGTAAIAGQVSNGMNRMNGASEESLELSKLTDSIKDLISNQGSTQNNTFNINGTFDPEEVAECVAQILAQQIKRRDALWA